MKISKRIISFVLTVATVIGVLASMPAIQISASQSMTVEATEEQKNTNYMTKVYSTPQEKLASMTLAYSNDDDTYRLYVNPYTGEVATEDVRTGQILFTNPYDIGSTNGSTKAGSGKAEALSQIIVNFSRNNERKTFYSYDQAASRGQISVRKIKTGICVEYTIGKDQSKMLVPRMIEKSRFEELILAPIEEAYKNGEISLLNYLKIVQAGASYTLYDPNDPNVTSAQLSQMYKEYPITATKKMAVYVFDTQTVDKELNKIEEIIKTHTEYTYNDLEYDHSLTEYVSQDTNPPIFKMALEYTIGQNGLSVRLPANSIRFNESIYQLESIRILPYMGAGYVYNDGYNFYPDGAGTIIDYEDMLANGSTEISSKLYGEDYAYQTITSKYEEAIRYPVYGSAEKSVYFKIETPVVSTETSGTTETETETGETETETGAESEVTYKNMAQALSELGYFKKLKDGETRDYSHTDVDSVLEALKELYPTATITKCEQDRGFLAVITEGDALTKLYNTCNTGLSDYTSLQLEVTPRPKDTYNVSDAISVGDSTEWTVVSSRKYVGNYRINYIMLTDDEIAAEKGINKYYECSWIGMAHAYSDYLESNGVLTRLTDADVTKDIPLYIETFGAISTVQKILSVPVNVMTAMTSFDDIKTMYKELSESGIKNINFKMTGYANGGMYATVPYNLNWEGAVGGSEGFKQLLEYADGVNENKDSNIGIYPDFDFSYVIEDKFFDGLDFSTDIIRSIDDRYTGKRVYSATKQAYISYYQMGLSPAYYSKFYEKLTENYSSYFKNNDYKMNISVSTLGTELNSDFDEGDPYNREDNKGFASNAFKYFDDNYDSVMTEGANAYAWKYIDHILGASLDSSRYIQSSYAVPFMGTVLHGYVQFAGDALNMEGDIDYAILKAIENGASLYFILSYKNTTALKEDEMLSKYYSVRYDIWKDEVIERYTQLNDVMSDVQTKIITSHKFLSGERIPDGDEIEGYIKDVTAEIDSVYAAYEKDAVYFANQYIRNIMLATAEADTYSDEIKAQVADILLAKTNYNTALVEFGKSISKNSDSMTDKQLIAAANAYITEFNSIVSIRNNYSDEVVAAIENIESLNQKYSDNFKILGRMILEEKGIINATNVTEITSSDKYEASENTIAMVTYGDKDNNGKYVDYKSFILNYNSYSVVVQDDVSGATYTIPAYGYVEIYR